MKHTPGPWILDKDGHVYAEKFMEPAPFTDKDGIHHADYITGLVALPYSCGDEFNGPANSQLIAAAPDMLEALKWFVDRCEKGEVRSNRTYAHFKEIIKKAEHI